MNIRCLSVLPRLSVLQAHVLSLLSVCLCLTYLMRVLHPVSCPLWTRCSEPVQTALGSSLSCSMCSSGARHSLSTSWGRCGGCGGFDLGHLSSLQGSAAQVASAASCSEAASPLAPARLTWVGYLTPHPHVPSACLLNYSFFLPPCSPRSGGWSVAQTCPTLCDPMDRSMPGFPVLHHLLEFAQIHVC